MNKMNFTLVELLIVIAIIILLAALLLPVLSQARQRAGAVSCINNLKQTAIASFNYCSDFGGWFIARYDANNPWKSELNKHKYTISNASVCPNQPLVNKPDSIDWKREAYGIILKTIDPALIANITHPGSSSTAQYINYNRLKPQAPTFFDSLRFYSGVAEQFFQGNNLTVGTTYNDGKPHSRHQNRINTAFVDCHVTSMDPKSFADLYNSGYRTAFGGSTAAIYYYNQFITITKADNP